MSSIHELPPNYTESLHHSLTEGKNLLWLNLAALLPAAVMILVLFGWWLPVVRAQFAPPADGDFTLPVWLTVLAALLIVLPLHELIHGVAIQLCGHRARYGMNLSKGVLYATADQALFRRNEYLLVALLPLVVITLLGMALLLMVSEWLVTAVSVAVIVNAGGAIGDLWAAAIVRRSPPEALVRDEEDSFRVYMPR